MHALRTRIEGHLAGFERIAIEAEGRRRAAVAIVLSPTPAGPAFLLTRRALHMRRGAGNYALPGGNVDPGEDAVDAARRETDEELGVKLSREAALGLLDDFVTLGGHVVTPVVFWTPEPVSIVPNPEEVHAAWHIPLADLDHPRAPRRVRNPAGGPAILRMFAQGSWVNPPTAAWLYQFREVCLHGRPCRTDGIGQPSWTAR
ncbi:MAG: CoA pyrophosphatase [Phenylobacterium sp.]|jgi:8-oxo-dGTP pyrophosphatase MutT (NUDIX family)|uniref:NUDIX hydrolase n=1 Tax=Phenylobacterium sp. TaxID=1871053 RepID=UPI001A2D51F3|nr:CoA pyrophosphatase [Phenylobacterium sp.]MBJ7409885.1 CoA pyrophosphatase [Phenylobacterium sp.]